MHSMPRRKLLAVIAILGAIAATYTFGYSPRQRTAKQLNAAAAARRITPPLVNSAIVKRAAPSSELLLPGNITPITEAYIFARAAGYLKRRYVDIGDRVRAGQKLADIEAPDLDRFPALEPPPPPQPAIASAIRAAAGRGVLTDLRGLICLLAVGIAQWALGARSWLLL